jgi:hypothetical protein
VVPIRYGRRSDRRMPRRPDEIDLAAHCGWLQDSGRMRRWRSPAVASMPDGGWIGAASRTDGADGVRALRSGRRGPWLYLSDARSRVPGACPVRLRKAKASAGDRSMAREYRAYSTAHAARRRGLVVWVHGGPNLHSGDEIDTLAQRMLASDSRSWIRTTGLHLFRCRSARRSRRRRLGAGVRQDDIRTGIEHLIAISEAKRGASASPACLMAATRAGMR